MMGWRIYGIIGLLLSFVVCVGFAYAKGYQNGRDAILSKLAADRIEILKDGKKIDEKVLSSDDADLVCMLVDCVHDKP